VLECSKLVMSHGGVKPVRPILKLFFAKFVMKTVTTQAIRSGSKLTSVGVVIAAIPMHSKKKVGVPGIKALNRLMKLL
jgi:hypothetical protein